MNSSMSASAPALPRGLYVITDSKLLAGHLLLILFALGGEYLLLHGAALVKPVGILAWVMFILIAFLELLVQFLQAYVFVLLNALYISGAIAEEH